MVHERYSTIEKFKKIHLLPPLINSNPGQPVSPLGICLIKETEEKRVGIKFNSGYSIRVDLWPPPGQIIMFKWS